MSKHACDDGMVNENSENGRALLDLAIALVDSGLDVLHKHLTTDKQLQHDSALIPGGTLGKHFRHVAETYGAFLNAIQANPYDAPQIDYNAQLPSSRDGVARTVGGCIDAMERVRNGLVALREANDLGELLAQRVQVIAITPSRQEMQSTLGRELWFCSLHAIHHYTMVRVIAVYELDLKLPIEFGTAPATIYYRGKGWKPPQVPHPTHFKAKL